MAKQGMLKTQRRKPAKAPAKPTPINATSVDGGLAEAPARPGGKLGLIVDRLGTKAGTTIEELAGMTSWQMHTVRAALSRLRTRGFAMRRDRDGERKAYRLERREG